MQPKDEDIFLSLPITEDLNRKTEHSNKMTPRPPFLSAFDYTFYLKRQLEKERIESGYDEADHPKESGYLDSLVGLSIETPKISDLLRKLAEDLRSHRGSFVEDFIDEPQNGISWLLDLLRSSLNRQQCPGMVISSGRDQPNKNKIVKNRERQHHLKRAMTDEYDCLLCLKHATTSSQKALHKILSHRNGLLTLASCIVSNLTKSRAIALELLTQVCDIQPDGSKKVLEAMSTMRIIFGESVRFKLLIAILNSSLGASIGGFEATVLTFLNNLLSKSTTNPAERVRLQSELEEAGLNVELLEKEAKEKSLPPDDPIWSEIRIWSERFIDVADCLKKNRALTRETCKLKEELESTRRAVAKMEQEKTSFIHIERELKDKVQDLEREVLLLRSRLSESGVKVNCRRRNKSSGRPASDDSDPVSCTVDSGRWSDSEGLANELGRSSGSDDKKNAKELGYSSSNEECNDDQNVRNEDIFIYIPSIRPPASFSMFIEKDSKTISSASGVKLSSESKNRPPKKSTQQKDESTNTADPARESRWKSKQLVTEDLEQKRPQIVDVYPKGKEDFSCSDSIVGADCENSEFTLDWQYPKIDKSHVFSRNSFARKSINKTAPISARNQQNHYVQHKDRHDHNDGRKQRSHSTGFLAEIDRNRLEEEKLDSKPTENWTQFMLKSRGSSMTSLNEDTVNKGSSSTKSEGKRKNGSKEKTFVSALQSYFFSGEGNKQRCDTSSLRESCDSSRSFPLPNVYKKNFITKGHGNCGLYSEKAAEKKKFLEISQKSTSSVSKMLHREIVLAAKEVGAFY